MEHIAPLKNTLSLVEGETPSSFISRLAAWNRAASAREFCNDFLLSFDKIASGAAVELEKLAHFTSANLRDLSAFAPQRVRQSVFRLGYENISQRIAARSLMRICPYCARDDIEANPTLPPDAAVAQRAIWLISSVRTCFRHACSLVSISMKAHPRFTHDFALRSAEALPEVERLFEECSQREPSNFERYIAQRIYGEQRVPVPLLDSLEVTDVDLICSWLGRFKLVGRSGKPRGASDHEMYLAAQAGFETLSNGEAAIRDLIQTSHDNADFTKCVRLTDDRLLGQLYRFLDNGGGMGPQYGEIRAIIANKLSELYPFSGEQARILGVTIPKRPIHSIGSAKIAYGLPRKTIKRYVKKAGIGLTFKKNGQDVCYAIDVREADELFGHGGQVINGGTIERQLRLRRCHLQGLHELGVLSPIGGEFIEGHTAFFRHNDVESKRRPDPTFRAGI